MEELKVKKIVEKLVVEVKLVEVELKKKWKKFFYKDQFEWDGIEDKIVQLEEKYEQFEVDIVVVGSDFGKI